MTSRSEMSEDGQLDPLYATLPGIFALEPAPEVLVEFPILEFDLDGDPWTLNPDVLDGVATPEQVALPQYVPINPFSQIGAFTGGYWPPMPKTPLPPPDCLGFYLPFHRYFRPRSSEQVWGIYLVASEIRSFGLWLQQQTRGSIPSVACCRAAQGFVYLHEYFHHRVESLVTRMEVTGDGRRAYLDWVQRKFMQGLRRAPPEVREEALADAYALRDADGMLKRIKPTLAASQRRALVRAFKAYAERTGPPYAAGLSLLEDADFLDSQDALCADYREPGAYDPCTRRHLSWRGAPFMTRGMRNVSSSFWYIWNLPGYPGRSVPRPWQRLKPAQLVRYAKHKGFTEDRQKGSHLQMKDPSGVTVTIPVHRGRDLKTGLAMAVIKKLGGTWGDYEAFADG